MDGVSQRMENEIIPKRSLIILLVIGTVVIFVALVVLIAIAGPRGKPDAQGATTTANPQLVRNCTYPLAYWKDHPELFPSQLIIGGIDYRERELDALLLDESQDLAQQLKVQLAVAFMNGQSGADQAPVESVVFDAYGWLVAHPAGSQVTEDDLSTGRQLFNELEAYNLGQAGVPACQASLLETGMGTSTGIVTGTFSLTVYPGSSLTPSETPTQAGTLLNPSITPRPTTSQPAAASPTPSPTRTSPPPSRTFTPTTVNTTQAPSPTHTAEPPTPTNTPEPPTPTNTPKPPTPTFTPPYTWTPTFTPAPP